MIDTQQWGAGKGFRDYTGGGMDRLCGVMKGGRRYLSALNFEPFPPNSPPSSSPPKYHFFLFVPV